MYREYGMKNNPRLIDNPLYAAARIDHTLFMIDSILNEIGFGDHTHSQNRALARAAMMMIERLQTDVLTENLVQDAGSNGNVPF